jgi:hypothetical protein
MNGGAQVELTVENIKRVNSPKNMVDGPFEVLYINPTTRWVLVTLTYDGYPTLGFRYFTDSCGSPNSRNYPTWMVVPEELYLATLMSLKLDSKKIYDTMNFLYGK